MKCATLLMALLVISRFTGSFANSKLLPFQSRLTDALGKPIPDGSRVVQFKMYDAPIGGNAVWRGEIHNLTVNRGIVNTILGSEADLSGIDFDNTLYLEITVDANSDNQITATDPPLLPRQCILPVIFTKEALEARKLAGYDWSVLFGDDSPAEGKISGSKIADRTITRAHLQPGSVGSAEIADRSITSNHLEPNAVKAEQIANKAVDSSKIADMAITSSHIAPGTITSTAIAASAIAWTNLAPRKTEQAAAAGNVAASEGTGAQWTSPSPRVLTRVPGLDMTLRTTGRPVHIFLSSTPGGSSYIYSERTTGNPCRVHIAVFRKNVATGEEIKVGETWQMDGSPGVVMYVSPSSFQFLDSAPPGEYLYTIRTQGHPSNAKEISLIQVRAIAFEL